MLAIQSTKPQKCTPNLLPARLNHNGPIHDADVYWKPETDDNGKPHAYFRGRHLHGTPLPLPSNYTGVILRTTDKELSQRQTDIHNLEEDDEEDEVETVPVKIAENIGEFQEIVVWGHGEEVDKAQDVFVRGVEEWMGFAEAMHVDADDAKDSKKQG